MKQVKLGNWETKVDNTDVEFLKRYEKAAAYYGKHAGALPEAASASEMMNAIYQVFEKTFEIIFDKGCCEKMFGEKKSVDECVSVYKALIEAVNDFTPTLDKINALTL